MALQSDAYSFSTLQELYLYGPDGFYEQSETGPGRERDFLTSPELGSVFAECLANALDDIWLQSGRPEVFGVVEAGAGRGTLATQLLRLPMQCADSLRYVAVERSANRRSELQAKFGSSIAIGSELPQSADVVFCNELLDNICVDIAEFDGDCWCEVLFDSDLRPVSRGPQLDIPVAVMAKPGTRVPLQHRQRSWVENARRVGRVLAVDYARSTQQMADARLEEWLRFYKRHASGLGDITCDVAIDQLPEAKISTQADWLEAHGITNIESRTRNVLGQELAAGGMEALRCRARLSEIAALTDPAGLGGFTVFEWSAL